ncbi:DUF1835 domain-containing protein [Burkholderia sp. FERM BP-3421]|jgi:Protein of unknown function/Domain of unknown function (DUF1835)|uniref:DUF1835 domain-containing protein n=1 Tax=Burkholderia sp. FERM BP-3421 TaxID=1494466 RepID=UPI002360D8E1|nr:DUF1835 domain-containing protein [Burkholderia sp. FERM BP-3421]WDD96028.1 DUF1835 domain-containing protein [Burkholderia sp. FERM BP-3421]
MSTLHVTLGGSAAASLRVALADAGRDERVIELRDDLAIGPLRGIDELPDTRAAFWERVMGDILPDWQTEVRDELATLEQLAAGDGQVVVWHAQSVADQLMLRRVAYHLRNVPQRLNEVRLSSADVDDPQSWVHLRTDTATATGIFPPATLRAKLPEAAPISVLRISRLALEWQEAKQANAELRYWIGNTFKSGHYADLDVLVLEHVPGEWAPAARTIGSVMGCADRGHLFVSDSIAFWRCRELAAAGRVELRGGEPSIDNLRALTLRAVPASPR